MQDNSLSPQATGVIATPERIHELSETILAHIRSSIREISEINLQARILSINAQIEAARAGEAGRSFSIVGQEMVGLSFRTENAAKKLEGESEQSLLELSEISRRLATDVQGQRLCDLALTNIDLIDRNLYERSCDCRWWATDIAMVGALENENPETTAHACERLGVILKAYTVYFDIVLARLDGTIVANGRPSEYTGSRNSNHRAAGWFVSAMATATGDEFGFETVHVSPLANQQRVLVYSCKVFSTAKAKPEPIGVLGVIFNWDGLAQKIMNETPISPANKQRTRVCIVDDHGLVLADSHNRILQEKISFSGSQALFEQAKANIITTVNGAESLVAHARSPGFETYRSGWHSLILEQVAR